MTIGTTDFPTWFFAGFYGGLGCCVLAMVMSLRALYTDIRRRVVSRRLVLVVVTCIASSLCLLLVFVWFDVDFNPQISLTEITALLSCVLVFGWLLPIGAAIFSSMMSRSRFSIIGNHKEQQVQK